ncbi:MAG: polynucleotide adenylyltransferase PcnB [Kangiellaceae bacterium]|nr:polynucleotide adenylyltransferase PcnB [Kangiellaceae bacterium]MCW8999347.1 polynucleotide adenylyltransferase PcnB [Kangiellaceae bacterium]
MLKNLWSKLTGSRTVEQPKCVVLTRDQHSVSRKKMSNNALKVLHRLNSSGYQAFLVGGGVRDMLLGLSPKDFDIATDATPEEVAGLFKNCRLVGRRFRLAHILFGREIIEVATFRASHHDTQDNKQPSHSNKIEKSKVSAEGLLVRDNVYGSLEEDAVRRDFTINALYYCAKDFTVRDSVGGIDDLNRRQLRLIGDPVERYTEDPVRILRAIRLSAKLDLTIETKTAAPIRTMSEMLEHVSPARLWDECNKLFLAGHAHQTWHVLLDYQVAAHLFPQTTQFLKTNSDYQQFIARALKSTDKRISQQQPVTPAFLFAVFLWQALQSQTEKLQSRGFSSYDAGQKAAEKIIELQRNTIAIPKRFSIVMREIWNLQYRLHNRRKKNVDSLIQHPRFRAAYDFLCLRANEDSTLAELAKWWTDFQEVHSEKRQEMLRQVSGNSPKKKRFNRRKKYQNKTSHKNRSGQ